MPWRWRSKLSRKGWLIVAIAPAIEYNPFWLYQLVPERVERDALPRLDRGSFDSHAISNVGGGGSQSELDVSDGLRRGLDRRRSPERTLMVDRGKVSGRNGQGRSLCSRSFDAPDISGRNGSHLAIRVVARR